MLNLEKASSFGSVSDSTQLMVLSLPKGSPSLKPYRVKSRERLASRKVHL
jgi:hypothetical protein